MAQEGGIGIVHKNMTIEQQAREVRSVKKFESGIIRDPITITPDRTVGELLKLTSEHNISGVPVVSGRELVGIVTSRDVRFEPRMDVKVSEVMTRKDKLVTAREGADTEEIRDLLHRYRIEKVLHDRTIASSCVGLITVKDIDKARMYPNACKDELGRLRVGASVGTSAETDDRVAALIEAGVDVLVVDTSHGHSKRVLDRVSWIKQKYPNVSLIGGNVATRAGARALADAGVDSVKVGIGPGSICTTRIVTGIGVPQVTAVSEVSDELETDGIPVDRRRRHPLFRRHCKSVSRRRQRRDGRQSARGNRRGAGRSRAVPRAHVQIVSRHGVARRDGTVERIERPLLPGARQRRRPQTRARRHRRSRAVSRRDGSDRAAVDGRPARGDGLYRLAGHRDDALAAGVRARHAREHDRESRPRREHHQRSAELPGQLTRKPMSNDAHVERLLVIDFGAQYTQLIARRIREAGVYCEIHPFDAPAEFIRNFGARGVVLSGGPESVTEDATPRIPDVVFELAAGRRFSASAMACRRWRISSAAACRVRRQREFGHARIRLGERSSLLSESAVARRTANSMSG